MDFITIKIGSTIFTQDNSENTGYVNIRNAGLSCVATETCLSEIKMQELNNDMLIRYIKNEGETRLDIDCYVEFGEVVRVNINSYSLSDKQVRTYLHDIPVLNMSFEYIIDGDDYIGGYSMQDLSDDIYSRAYGLIMHHAKSRNSNMPKA